VVLLGCGVFSELSASHIIIASIHPLIDKNSVLCIHNLSVIREVRLTVQIVPEESEYILLVKV
jgi:hypothetical protein